MPTSIGNNTTIRVPGDPAETIPPRTGSRLSSIDLLRGLVMVIMALDHTRDFFHRDAMLHDPLDLTTTTPLLFLTRFITHFCAPVFVFLAGTSGWLQARRKPPRELSAFLIKRGIWLIFAEMALMSFTLTFDPGYHMIFLQTIWSIGISMVLLGLAVWLPLWAVFTAGALIVLGHNALDYFEAGRTAFPAWYVLLHRPGPIPIGGGRMLFVTYPFLPWTGLMLLGYCFGRLYTTLAPQERRRRLVMLGAGLLLFFTILRAFNGYGDRQHWSAQDSALNTFFSFINVVKYPPSLLFMCITIGPAILFLAYTGETRSRFGRIITVYGSVPFFYYFLHFLLLHLLAAAFYLMRGHTVAQGFAETSGMNFIARGEGVSLAAVYAIWIGMVAFLYLPCRWFSAYKKTHRQWWVHYL